MPIVSKIVIDCRVDVDVYNKDNSVVVLHTQIDGKNFYATGPNQTEALLELAIFLNSSGEIS